MRRRAIVALAAAAFAALPARADLGGRLFEDRDADGVRDAGEPPMPGFSVRLYGTRDTGGGVDLTMSTAADGSFLFTPGEGCYLVEPVVPPDWRVAPARADRFPSSSPGYTHPVGMPRFGALTQGIANMQASAWRSTAMGDSIAVNFSVCDLEADFDYSRELNARLACAAGPGVAFSLDEAAVKRRHTDDLLVLDPNSLNNVKPFIGPGGVKPQLISISMIGNDLLDVDPGGTPTQAQTNRAAEEILDARMNLQEAISTLVAEVLGADILLNTLYDNEAWNCATGNATQFHRQWLPIVNAVLRDLAWGQARRVVVNEVAADFAAEDLLGVCTGYAGMICRDFFGLDNIHPNPAGYAIVMEKIWEAAGGARLGPTDTLGRTAILGHDHGLIRRVRRLSPGLWETRGAASVATPQAAFDGADGGAAAGVTIGSGDAEFRLSGFPDWYDEVRIVKATVGVRYRTTGLVEMDPYRIEASVTGVFRAPPGHAYSPTSWNFFTPIVGGGGASQPPSNPDFPSAVVLAVPNVAAPREVTATLTKNPVIAPGGGRYDWPAIDHDDLVTTVVRVAAAALAPGPVSDSYTVEVDHAWIDLWGWEAARPAEVTGVRVDPAPGGAIDISFDPVAGAQRYNVYFGRTASLASGYDHGATAPAGPLCGVAASPAGGGRLEVRVESAGQPAPDAYVLVTAHVQDVESPSGFDSSGMEIDRAGSICR